MKAKSVFHELMQQSERRQWRLWALAMVISLLLTVAASSLAFTVLRTQGESFYFVSTRQAVYGLLALLLLFDFYVILQQIQNRRIGRQLHEQYEIFRLIGENASDLIAVVDVSGRRLYNSPSYATVLGYSPDELGSSQAFEQIHPDDRQRVKEAADEARRTGLGQSVEYRFRHKDGTWRTLESTASVIRNASGDPDKLIIINRDITARRQAEKEHRENRLRQAGKMEALGRLSGGIAHDFNNLLCVILGYTEVLAEGSPNDEMLRKGMREIQRAGKTAATLTRQLLAFSRQQVLEPKILDLNVVVADLETMLRRLIGEDISIHTRLDHDLGRVLADRGQMEQVLMNLAINARDAMPDGGKLSITTARAELDDTYERYTPEVKPGKYVQLSVSDTGIGMDAATQAHIFEPFFTTKELGRGTGLGLATVYGVVKQSNGYIWIYSEVGKGTTFKIYLPEVAGDEQAVATEIPRSHAEHGEETILLVEDEDSLRDVTRDLLLQSGYQVLEAHCGDRALEIARSHAGNIHLLLTDVVMPGMNGPAIAQELSRSRPDIKILYMSGYTNQAIAPHGILESGVLLLEKPYSRATLAGKVREALDAKNSRPVPALTAEKPLPLRRSGRLHLRVPLRVKWTIDRSTSCEEEETETSAVNAHGALVTLKLAPRLGQHITVQNSTTHESQDATVAFLSDEVDGPFKVGVEFMKPNPSFWRVTFPPDDWSSIHPDAKVHQPFADGD